LPDNPNYTFNIHVTKIVIYHFLTLSLHMCTVVSLQGRQGSLAVTNVLITPEFAMDPCGNHTSAVGREPPLAVAVEWEGQQNHQRTSGNAPPAKKNATQTSMPGTEEHTPREEGLDTKGEENANGTSEQATSSQTCVAVSSL